MASTISAGLTTTTALVYSADTSGVLQLQTNGTTTAVTIDTSQRVGIGTVSPSAPLEISTGGGTKLRVTSTIDNNADIDFYTNGVYRGIIEGNSAGMLFGTIGALPNIFITNNTERARIDNSGNLYLGTTSQIGTSQLSVVGVGVKNGITVQVASSSYQNYQGFNTSGTTSFYVESGGAIHSTSTSITAISDQTLKTNIKPLETGLAEINKLQPRRFDWIVDSGMTEKNVAGFISQEVEPILPDLVSPWKQTDEITLLGLKMGDMIPTMVKAIQELSAKVTALEAKVG